MKELLIVIPSFISIQINTNKLISESRKVMGQLIYLAAPNKEKSKDELITSKFAGNSCSMQGWRKSMEDAHVMYSDDQLSLFAVFDGHGGSEVAKYCGKNVVDVFKSIEKEKSGNIKDALIETFLKLDENMLKEAGQKELREFKDNPEGEMLAGCTANVAVLVNGELYVANAGDSRAVINSGGIAVEMSIDHKPDDKDEQDRIQSAGGFISEGRVNGNLNLSRALGDFEYKRDAALEPKQQIITCYPDVRVRQITPNDEFLIMGCDGIWETKSNQEMVDYIKEKLQKGFDAGTVLEHLLDDLCAVDSLSAAGKGCDNMSSVLIIFKH